MPSYEGLRLKILKYNRKLFGNLHRRKLKNSNFTIISNNCWGGEVYEYYNLQKQSPTVGLFFMADDYLKFLTHIHEYLNTKLEFISPSDSKWKDWPQVSGNNRFGHYPVGRLRLDDEDIEVFFLHYNSEKEALSKWERRCARINWNKLIVKFNDQNGCRSTHIELFSKLPYKVKLFFTVKNWNNKEFYNNIYYYKVNQRGKSKEVKASYEPFGKKKDINITEIINLL